MAIQGKELKAGSKWDLTINHLWKTKQTYIEIRREKRGASERKGFAEKRCRKEDGAVGCPTQSPPSGHSLPRGQMAGCPFRLPPLQWPWRSRSLPAPTPSARSRGMCVAGAPEWQCSAILPHRPPPGSQGKHQWMNPKSGREFHADHRSFCSHLKALDNIFRSTVLAPLSTALRPGAASDTVSHENIMSFKLIKIYLMGFGLQPTVIMYKSVHTKHTHTHTHTYTYIYPHV